MEPSRIQTRRAFLQTCGAVLAASTSAALASGPFADIASTSIGGREYYRLGDWARRNGFDIRWNSPEPIIRMSSKWATLQFTADSHKALINGVAVHLCFPIAARTSGAWISELDLVKTLHPILYPGRNKSGIPPVQICLDPGHGGKDPGNHAGSLLEKKYTLQLATALRNRLTRAGFDVSQTRHHDVFIAPADRPRVASRHKADLFLSLHFNATVTAKNEVRGAEVYAFTPVGAASTNSRGDGTEYHPSTGNRLDDKNILLAYQLQRALTRSLPVEDRGVRRARFAVLRDANVPAALVEAGYLSHPSEGRRIADPAYLEQVAEALTDGLMAYKRLVERQ